LEVVCGYNKSLNLENDDYGWPKMDNDFQNACIAVIKRQKFEGKLKDDWISDLEGWESGRENDGIQGNFKAQDVFFGLLLVLLPNLRRLLLGTLNIANIRAFPYLLWDTHPTPDMPTPRRPWHNGYLMETLLIAAPKLTQREIPLHWTHPGYARIKPEASGNINSLFPFQNLRTLTIPVEAFEPPTTVAPGAPRQLRNILIPMKIEHIDIVDSGDWFITSWLPKLLETNKPRCPRLRTVHVFRFHGSQPHMRKQHWNPVHSLAESLGIDVRVYNSDSRSIGKRTTMLSYLQNRDGSRLGLVEAEDVDIEE
jgi:hypothetical protein